MSDEMLKLADEIAAAIAVTIRKRDEAGKVVQESIMARHRDLIVTALRAAASAEPVAFVPVHPRHGPLWSDTYAAGSQVARSGNYERRPLYTSPAPDAEIVAELEDLVNATVNPGDGGPYEVGEFPELDRARAALAKAKGGSQPVARQPGSTAPKDGRRLILFWDDSDTLPMHFELGWWADGSWRNTYGKPFSGEPTHWFDPVTLKDLRK